MEAAGREATNIQERAMSKNDKQELIETLKQAREAGQTELTVRVDAETLPLVDEIASLNTLTLRANDWVRRSDYPHALEPGFEGGRQSFIAAAQFLEGKASGFANSSLVVFDRAQLERLGLAQRPESVRQRKPPELKSSWPVSC